MSSDNGPAHRGVRWGVGGRKYKVSIALGPELQCFLKVKAHLLR